MSGGHDLFADVGAVVVTGVELSLALECVRSLGSAVTPSRIVVVVNPPADRDSELGDLRAHATVIVNDEPTGYGACLNLGVRCLAGEVEYVLLLNDDVVVDLEGLCGLVAVLRGHEDAAIVAPNLVDRAGDPEPTAFAFPSIASELTQMALLPQELHRRLRLRYAAYAAPGEPRSADWVLGAAVLVRRAAFEQAGGFDERFVFYSEETDLCRRLRSQGWRTLSFGSATFVHVGAASQRRGGDVARRFGAMAGRSRRLYLDLHWSAARRGALVFGTVLVFVWNAAYVLLRVAVAPRTIDSKLELLWKRWQTRPVLRREDAP